MAVALTPKRKFIKWFVRPYNRLKRVPTGDGAFVILSMGFQLCERYFRIKSNTITKHWKYTFLKRAAKAYNTDQTLFGDFWFLYRHGLQHQGSPKKKVKVHDSKKVRRYKWAISDSFTYRPTICNHKGRKVICIYPNEFTAFMLRLFLRNTKLLERSVSHAFGDIFPMPGDCQCQPKPGKTP